eukprot:gene11360-11509_t
MAEERLQGLMAGVARLAGSTGSKRSAPAVAADSVSLDAFLGKASSGSSRAAGPASAAAGPFGVAGSAVAKFESLDAIEQILFQAAPKDLAAAVKQKKKHKKKAKQEEA